MQKERSVPITSYKLFSFSNRSPLPPISRSFWPSSFGTLVLLFPLIYSLIYLFVLLFFYLKVKKRMRKGRGRLKDENEFRERWKFMLSEEVNRLFPLVCTATRPFPREFLKRRTIFRCESTLLGIFGY